MRDCEWSSWTKEEECSRTCGQGIQKLARYKTVRDQNGGQCDGTSTKKEQCNLKECSGEPGLG